MKRMLGSVSLAAVLAGVYVSAASAQGYTPPRGADGKPDLQGVWTNVSLTTLERPSRYAGLTVSAEEAAQRAKMAAAQQAAANAPTRAGEGAPTSGGGIGGYNAFWIDSGDRLAVVKGQTRTAWIVDPPDGRVPYSAHGKKMFDKFHARADNDFDDPEGRTPADRCIVGFGSTAGPPMMNVMYNNNYQIVQTPGHVVIMVEMNHDARVIPIGAKHGPAIAGKWLGDSVGWWDGDTLVVETVGIEAQNTMRATGAQSFYLGEHPKITERFTRVGEKEILYEFQVEEPTTFTRPWKAEMPMLQASGPIYEYACHEGNYALPGMLAGARKFEAEGRDSKMRYYAREVR